jgi:hypothetical protein
MWARSDLATEDFEDAVEFRSQPPTMHVVLDSGIALAAPPFGLGCPSTLFGAFSLL